MLSALKVNIYKYRLVLVSIIMLFSITADAQNLTADDFFKAARNKAFNDKDYTTAVQLAKKALELNPQYIDVTIFIGRAYAWNKQPDSARIFFQVALRQKPEIEDIYAGYTDLEYWSHNYDEALSIVKQGLYYHPSSTSLLMREAKVLHAQRKFRDAIVVVDTVLQLDKNNTEARTLASQIRDNISRNRLGLKYDFITFDKQFANPWHLLSMDYTRQTKMGPLTARVNYANRFNTNGLQYELESYPVFSKTFYAYLNTGYSDDVGIFPKWKAGASLYANLPKAFETEIGIRYIYFSSSVFVYTLYVGKYYKSFLLGARTYLTPVASNISQSYSVMARYYYGGIDDYIGLNIGAGISPDDRRVNIQLNSAYKLRTYTAELTLRHAIRKLNVVVLNLSILNQEYLPGTIGNQFQAGVGYIRRF
jgi:YaiO family outer membrane protein